MRCRINNIDNRTLNIIKQGQTLPFTNTVDTCTVVDNQECIVCDILFGNNDNADNNKPLLKIRLENLPKLKAGQSKTQDQSYDRYQWVYACRIRLYQYRNSKRSSI